MNIRQFRSELAQAFEATGFERKKIKASQATIWVLPGREVERRFWEHAIRRPWGFLLGGSLCVDVPAFRTWLTNHFPSDQHGVLWSNLLGRNIANERDMFFAVDEEDQPPYRIWAEDIRTRLAAIPDTIAGLLEAERQPQRLRLVWDGWTAPKAWDYFSRWASGEEPCQPPPYMLPTGQIVDAPANDPA